MKIAFVETPSPWLVRPRAQAALGPLYLATILKDAGHEVQIVRPNSLNDLEELAGWDTAAFTGTTLEYPMVRDCARWVHANLPEVKIWYGGPHVTAWCERKYDQLTIPRCFDAIGIGESEGYITRMALDQVAGRLARFYRAVESIDLETIPLPDRTLIQGDHGGDIFSYYRNYHGAGSESVISARGCTHACAFCASESMWGHNVRFRSVGSVDREIRSIIDTTGCRQIRFADDHFAAQPKRAMRLCRVIEPLGIAWRCSVRADSLTKDLCEAMAAAGCKEISPGIESGDPRVLAALKKRTCLADQLAGCRRATEAGIDVRALFMIGTPGEREDTPEINRDYMTTLPCHSITLSTFVPLPGTAIWRNPRAFDCDILDWDFEHYNKDFWVAGTAEHGEAGGRRKREYVPLIRNRLLTPAQQADNVARMQRYVEETGKCNLG